MEERKKEILFRILSYKIIYKVKKYIYKTEYFVQGLWFNYMHGWYGKVFDHFTLDNLISSSSGPSSGADSFSMMTYRTCSHRNLRNHFQKC